MHIICIFSFRLEEKLSNVESENKVLRQQAVSMAPAKILSGRSKSNLQVSQLVVMFYPLFLLGEYIDNIHCFFIFTEECGKWSCIS